MKAVFVARSIIKGELPKEGQIIHACVKDKKVLCIFENGKFFRHTDNSGNDRLLNFYYNDITDWLEEIPVSEFLKSILPKGEIAEKDFENVLNALHDPELPLNEKDGAEECFLLAQQMVAIVIQDYEEVLKDKHRLVREIDVILNGEEGAARQASLCDLVSQIRDLKIISLLNK